MPGRPTNCAPASCRLTLNIVAKRTVSAWIQFLFDLRATLLYLCALLQLLRYHDEAGRYRVRWLPEKVSKASGDVDDAVDRVMASYEICPRLNFWELKKSE